MWVAVDVEAEIMCMEGVTACSTQESQVKVGMVRGHAVC